MNATRYLYLSITLLTGSIITYWMYRDLSNTILIKATGIDSLFIHQHRSAFIKQTLLSNSLSDALWAFSMVLFIVYSVVKLGASKNWLIIVALGLIFLEVAQLGMLGGTFDWLDLGAYLMAGLTSVYYFNKIH